MDFQKYYEEKHKKAPDPEVIRLYEEIKEKENDLAKEAVDRMRQKGDHSTLNSLREIFREHGYQSMEMDGIFYEILNIATQIMLKENREVDEEKYMKKAPSTPEDELHRQKKKLGSGPISESDAYHRWEQQNEK